MRMSQFVLSSALKFSKHVFAFTQERVAMLSSVLRSDRAVHVNIAIMRTFVRLREAMASSKEFARRLDELERPIASHDENIRTLFQAIRQLMAPKEGQRKKIGFQLKEKRAVIGAGDGIKKFAFCLERSAIQAQRSYRLKAASRVKRSVLHSTHDSAQICGLWTDDP